MGISSQLAEAFGIMRFMHEVDGIYRSANPARRRPEELAAEPCIMPISCTETSPAFNSMNCALFSSIFSMGSSLFNVEFLSSIRLCSRASFYDCPGLRSSLHLLHQHCPMRPIWCRISWDLLAKMDYLDATVRTCYWQLVYKTNA